MAPLRCSGFYQRGLVDSVIQTDIDIVVLRQNIIDCIVQIGCTRVCPVL